MRPIESLERRTLLAAELLRDINLQSPGSNASDPELSGGSVWFTAESSSPAGTYLYRSTDGTLATTTRFARLDTMPLGGNPPRNFTALPNGRVVFRAGDRVFSTDGTAGGSFEITTSQLARPIGDFVVMGGNAYLRAFANNVPAAGTALFRTDGTSVGTTAVATGLSADAAMWVTPNRVFFHAGRFSDSSLPNGLWSSDGTAAGTSLIKDFLPGQTDAFGATAALGNTLLFTTATEDEGIELWRSDGTSAGTQLVKDINVEDSAIPRNFAVFNGRLFFQATTVESGSELWISDGTAAGTAQVTDLRPGSANGASGAMGVIDGKGVVFIGWNAAENRARLFVSDGTAGNTLPIVPTAGTPEAAVTGYTRIASAGSRVFFARAVSGVERIYATDGTAAGTKLLTGPAGAATAALVPVNGAVLFTAADFVRGANVHRADANASGVFFMPSYRTNDMSVVEAVEAGSRWFFTASDDASHSLGLWVTDGAPSGTLKLYEVTDGSYPRNLVPMGSRVAFRSSGNASARLLVADASGTLVDIDSVRTVAFAAGGRWYYLDANRVFKSTSGVAGDVVIEQALPPVADVTPNDYAVVGSRVYFSANTNAAGDEPWWFDTSTRQFGKLADLTPGTDSSRPSQFRAVGGRVLFVAKPAGYDLMHVSDGTTTAPLTPTGGSSGLYVRGDTLQVGNTVYVVGSLDSTFVQVWRTDGTAAGTVPLTNFGFNQLSIYRDSAAQTVPSLAYFAGALHFTNRDTDFAVGLEGLWRIDPAAAVGAVQIRSDVSPGVLTGSDGLYLRVGGAVQRYAAGAFTDMAASGELKFAVGGNPVIHRSEPRYGRELFAVTPGTTSPRPINFSVSAVAPSPRPTPLGSITIGFAEQVGAFDVGDLILRRNGGPNLLAGASGLTLTTVDNQVFLLGGLGALTDASGTYTLEVRTDGSGVYDITGSRLTGVATRSWRKYRLGDMNDDGVLNNLDIAPFVQALTNPAAFEAAFPGVVASLWGDMNGDGTLNNLDIAAFVAALTSGPAAAPAGVRGTGTVGTPAAEAEGSVAVTLFSDEPLTTRSTSTRAPRAATTR